MALLEANWNPIETAPKNNTWVWIREGDKVCCARYENGRWVSRQNQTFWTDLSTAKNWLAMFGTKLLSESDDEWFRNTMMYGTTKME